MQKRGGVKGKERKGSAEGSLSDEKAPSMDIEISVPNRYLTTQFDLCVIVVTIFSNTKSLKYRLKDTGDESCFD